MQRLKGKIAIVTGAAEGIGAAAAGLFVKEGAAVVLTDIKQVKGAEQAQIIAERHRGATRFVAHDVGDEAGWRDVMRCVEEEFGKLDILVNNAGIQITRALEDITLDEWRKVFSVNAEGPFLGTRHAIPLMKVSGGAIVNVSSTFAMVADGLNAHYCASKAAVRNFTKAAALYCADRGYNIRVNSVHPGVIRTPMVEREIRDVAAARGFDSTAEVEADWARLCPLGIGTSEDIAEGILYLSSDAARYVTGSELVIDGGHIAR